jgi:hypothetical protein
MIANQLVGSQFRWRTLLDCCAVQCGSLRQAVSETNRRYQELQKALCLMALQTQCKQMPCTYIYRWGPRHHDCQSCQGSKPQISACLVCDSPVGQAAASLTLMLL